MLDHIYLDIETIPCQHPERLLEIQESCTLAANSKIAALAPPKSLKKPESIDEWIKNELPEKKKEIQEAAIAEANEKYARDSFDGWYGKIAVISLALNDRDPFSLWVSDYEKNDSELFILQQLNNAIENIVKDARGKLPTFVGHNIIDFDLNFIGRRCVVNNVPPHPAIPFSAKPWDDRVFDTMKKFAAYQDKVSLAKLCKVLNAQAKGEEIGEDIDGSMVWDFVRSGRIADVAKYCEGDVRRVRTIHQRMTFQATSEMKVAA